LGGTFLMNRSALPRAMKRKKPTKRTAAATSNVPLVRKPRMLSMMPTYQTSF
jgi:hypothetical protein